MSEISRCFLLCSLLGENKLKRSSLKQNMYAQTERELANATKLKKVTIRGELVWQKDNYSNT